MIEGLRLDEHRDDQANIEGKHSINRLLPVFWKYSIQRIKSTRKKLVQKYDRLAFTPELKGVQHITTVLEDIRYSF